MAIVFAAGAGEATLRIQWQDVRGEEMIQNIPLDPDTTEVEAIAIITALEALSNARIVSAKLFVGTAASGFRATATSAVEALVAARMGLTFGKTNPVNANARVERTVVIPAYLNAIWASGGRPVTGNTTLDNLISSLSSRLTMTGSNGNYYPGSWLYDRDRSRAFTVTTVTDGV